MIWASDNGPKFRNHLVEALEKVYETRHEFSLAYHPMKQGAVERKNRTIIQELAKKCLKFKNKWSRHLPWIEFAINSTPHRGLGRSPYAFMFNRDPRVPTQNMLPLEVDTKGWKLNMKTFWNEAQAKVTGMHKIREENLVKYHAEFNPNHRKRSEPLKPGDWVKRNLLGEGRVKMSLHWEGPFVVKKRLDPKEGEGKVGNVYIIVDGDGEEYKHSLFDLDLYHHSYKTTELNPPNLDNDSDDDHLFKTPPTTPMLQKMESMDAELFEQLFGSDDDEEESFFQPVINNNLQQYVQQLLQPTATPPRQQASPQQFGNNNDVSSSDDESDGPDDVSSSDDESDGPDDQRPTIRVNNNHDNVQLPVRTNAIDKTEDSLMEDGNPLLGAEGGPSSEDDVTIKPLPEEPHVDDEGSDWSNDDEDEGDASTILHRQPRRNMLSRLEDSHMMDLSTFLSQAETEPAVLSLPESPIQLPPEEGTDAEDEDEEVTNFSTRVRRGSGTDATPMRPIHCSTPTVSRPPANLPLRELKQLQPLNQPGLRESVLDPFRTRSRSRTRRRLRGDMDDEEEKRQDHACHHNDDEDDNNNGND